MSNNSNPPPHSYPHSAHYWAWQGIVTAVISPGPSQYIMWCCEYHNLLTWVVIIFTVTQSNDMAIWNTTHTHSLPLVTNFTALVCWKLYSVIQYGGLGKNSCNYFHGICECGVSDGNCEWCASDGICECAVSDSPIHLSTPGRVGGSSISSDTPSCECVASDSPIHLSTPDRAVGGSISSDTSACECAVSDSPIHLSSFWRLQGGWQEYIEWYLSLWMWMNQEEYLIQ